MYVANTTFFQFSSYGKYHIFSIQPMWQIPHFFQFNSCGKYHIFSLLFKSFLLCVTNQLLCILLSCHKKWQRKHFGGIYGTIAGSTFFTTKNPSKCLETAILPLKSTNGFLLPKTPLREGLKKKKKKLMD